MLVVVGDALRRSGGRRVRVRCDCGVEQEMFLAEVKRSRTGSCGCLVPALTAAMSTRHGHTTHRSASPEYTAWKGIVRRCTNPRFPGYRNYGARGITVCDEWRDDFPAFLAHVGPRPSPKHSIDRIDNAKGYEPGNVRWATQTEQMLNTRNNHRITAFGETLTISEWSQRTGVLATTIYRRVMRGLPAEEAVSQQ